MLQSDDGVWYGELPRMAEYLVSVTCQWLTCDPVVAILIPLTAISCEVVALRHHPNVLSSEAIAKE